MHSVSDSAIAMTRARVPQSFPTRVRYSGLYVRPGCRHCLCDAPLDLAPEFICSSHDGEVIEGPGASVIEVERADQRLVQGWLLVGVQVSQESTEVVAADGLHII